MDKAKQMWASVESFANGDQSLQKIFSDTVKAQLTECVRKSSGCSFVILLVAAAAVGVHLRRRKS